MATNVEKYSHSCVDGWSCVPVDVLQHFWQMENVGRFEMKGTQIQSKQIELNKLTRGGTEPVPWVVKGDNATAFVEWEGRLPHG